MPQKEQKEQEQHYVIIDHKHVPLDDAQWRAWNKFRNQTRYYARRTYSCAQPDFRKCQGDCCLCRWSQEGLNVHLDIWHEDEYELLEDAMDLDPVADAVAVKDLEERILSFADELDEFGGALLYMRLMEGRTYAELSHTLGISAEEARYRTNRILKKIRTVKKFFID